MIRARDSLDPWAIRAHYILDKAKRGGHTPAEQVVWALRYLGDARGDTRIPSSLCRAQPAEVKEAIGHNTQLFMLDRRALAASGDAIGVKP